MSQPNQPNQSQGASSPAKKTYRIRMKQGKGRMLIGREWIKEDGTATRVRPKNVDDRENSNDEYLEARTQDGEGNWSDGPVVVVTEDVIAPFMTDSKDGQPHRIIDGYKMNEEKGGQAPDETGEMRNIKANWSPTKQRGVTDDCPFEILKSA